MTIQCDSCGKKFNASDALAGKRVRCRGCGEIITVPRLTSPDDGDIEDAGFEAAPPPSRPAGRGRPVGERLNPTDERTISPAVDIGYEVDDGDDDKSARRGELRPNTPLPFPGSAVVDQLLPYVLLCLSLGWVLIEMLRNNELGPIWVPVVRVGTFLAIYLAAVWPVTRVGSVKGAERAGVELPPNHAWRVLCTFIFPATLGYVLWSINGGMGSFVAGAVVGLVISLGAYYVLFRLEPEEAGKAMPWVGGFYVASVVAGVAAFVGINFAVMTILSAGRTAHEYATSPLGRQLPWNPPVPPEDAFKLAMRPKVPLVVRSTVTTGPTTMQSTLSAGADLPPATTLLGAIVPGGTVPDGIVPRGIAGAAGTDFPPETTRPTGVNANAAGTVVTVEPTGGSSLFGPDEGSVGANTPATAGPAVTPKAESPVRPVTEVGAFTTGVFPLTPSRHVLIVRRDESNQQDGVEVWDLAAKRKVGETTFQRDLTQSPDYALSPDGKTIARLNAFPTLSVMTWSVPDNRPGRPLILNKSIGEPSIIGFSDNGQVWLKWENSVKGVTKSGMEGFDLATAQRIKAIDLPNYVKTGAGVSISPDGKLFAVIKSMKGIATHEVSVTNLRTGAMFRRLPLVGVDAQFAEGATGIAFSHDMTKLALVVESNNQGLLFDWQITPGADTKPVNQHQFPAGFAGVRNGNDGAIANRVVRNRNVEARPRMLDWLADNSGWLVNGTGIYDANSGLLKHDLGVTAAAAQRVVDRSTIEVVASSSEPKDAPRVPGTARTFGKESELLIADPSKLGAAAK